MGTLIEYFPSKSVDVVADVPFTVRLTPGIGTLPLSLTVPFTVICPNVATVHNMVKNNHINLYFILIYFFINAKT
ncbi:hypothetical protein D3C84_668290 [compost metagenome]